MATNTEIRTQNNWADVLPDLLHLITRKLDDLPDFIRFRAVCKSWCMAAPISDPPPQQVPWIMEARDPSTWDYDDDTRDPDHIRFFSPVSGKFYKINIPDLHWVQGPALDGYVLTDGYPHEGLSLVNPLTNHVVCLPPLPGRGLPGRNFRQGENYVIINASYDFYPLVCQLKTTYHPGDDKWVEMQDNCRTRSKICCKGMYFSTSIATSNTIIINIATKTLIGVVPPPENTLVGRIVLDTTLVESFGEILRVEMIFNNCRDKINFDICKLIFDNEIKNSCWVKIDNIGDLILFLSNAKFCPNGFTLKASQCPGLKGNSIYFNFISDGYGEEVSLFRYGILDGELENMGATFTHCEFFVPSLQRLNYPSTQ